MKILVTGSNGQMGNEFRVLAGQYPQYEFLFTDVEELDITRPAALIPFFSTNHPGIVINCAAYTAVDKAESEPEKAFLINAAATGYLAEACRRSDSLLIHISTDYIFGGRSSNPYSEDHPPDPSGIYAKSKYEGELELRKKGADAIIIRTSWLYSSFGNNFVKTILRHAADTGKLRVVSDQIGSPTYARDLSRAILEILPLLKGYRGIDVFHYSNEGEVTWCGFAEEIVKNAGIPCEITPIGTEAYPTPARRPAYSVLDKSKIKSRFGITIPHWKASLRECMELLLNEKR